VVKPVNTGAAGALGETAPPESTHVAAREPAAVAPVRWPAADEQDAQRRALAAARDVLKDDSNHPRALRDEYEALKALGRQAEANETLARLAALELDDLDLQLTYAEQLLRSERWMTATHVLRHVVDLAPEEPRGWRYLAVAQQSLGHLSEAAESWGHVLAALPDDATALASRGTLRQKLGDWAGAEQDLARAGTLDPNDVASVLSRSIALVKLGRAAEAEQIVRDVLVKRPNYVPALNRLAELCWSAYRDGQAQDSSRLTETVALCRRSLSLDPAQPVVAALLDEAEGALPSVSP